MASNTDKLFHVPSGGVVQVRIIESTSRINRLPTKYLMGPPVPGFDYMPALPSWSFLVEHASSGGNVLFDLGIPKDWDHMAAPVVKHLHSSGWEITVQKNVAEVLQEANYDLNRINSIIWSHWHWDHLGDPSTFPSTTEVVVGPGFKAEFMPGWPAKEDSPVRESDFKGRNLREIDFAEGDQNVLKVGDFRAFDFFGDGSFYLLDTPGHAIGHLCGLARTTANPDTFVLMGGDLCHHGGEMRPSEHLPLPAQISPNPLTRTLNPPCPGAEFEALQKRRSRSPQQPFFDPAMGLSIPEAIRSITKAQKADADENVLFIYAHDASVHGVVDLFPLTINDWKKKGWRDRMLWAFLEDLVPAIKPSM